MSNRIDSNQPAPASQPVDGAVDGADDGRAEQSALAECASDPLGFFADQWDSAVDTAEEFISEMTGGAAKNEKTSASKDDSMSLLELQAQSAAPKADDSAANSMESKLAELLSNEDISFDDIRYCTDTSRAFGPINKAITGLTSADRKALAEIIADPKEGRAFFKEALSRRSDIPDGIFTERNEHIDEACNALLEEAQEAIVGNFEEQVAERVQSIVRNASKPYEAINDSSQTRRAFLGQLAQLEGDPAKLEARLSAFGLGEDAAQDIAQVLADVHGDPKALDALVSGEEGPDRAGVHVFEEGNAFAFAEEVLEEELGGKLELLEQFGRQAGNGQITGSLLTNDNFKSLRDKVLTEMEGGKGGPIEQIVARHTEEVESDETATDVAKIIVSVGTAIGVTVATAGLGGAAALGAALATGGAEAAPDLLVAFEDVDLAEMAAQKELVMPDGTKVSVGMTDEQAVEDARYNRNVTAACAMAGLVLGAAPAIKEIKHGAAGAGDVVGEVLKETATAGSLGTVDAAAKK